MKFYIALIVMGILTQNFVLSRLLGVNPFINGSDSVKNALKISAPVIPVMIIAAAVNHPVNALLEKLSLGWLKTLAFIIVIVAVVSVIDILIKKISENKEKQITELFPLVTTNCAVLGIVLMNAEKAEIFSGINYSFLHAVIFAAACGAGFMTAMLLFASVRSRLEDAPVPKALQGTPIILISASIVSLCFSGFTGIVEGMGLI